VILARHSGICSSATPSFPTPQCYFHSKKELDIHIKYQLSSVLSAGHVPHLIPVEISKVQTLTLLSSSPLQEVVHFYKQCLLSKRQD